MNHTSHRRDSKAVLDEAIQELALARSRVTRLSATEDELRLIRALADSTSIALESVALRAALERRVADRTAALEAPDRELEDFDDAVCHDPCSPLRRALSYAEILDDEYAPQLDPQGRKCIAGIRQALEQLTALTGDLLRLSRAGRGELRREATDLSAMAREIAARLAATDPEREVRWEIEDDVTCHGDPELLRIVLETLLGNAWRLTARRADATIELGQQIGDGGAVYLVRDNGMGFDAAQAERLFEPFRRGHEPREIEGTGIGLAIVNRIVTRHGGRIWAEGVPEEGATFYWTLPAEELPGARRS